MYSSQLPLQGTGLRNALLNVILRRDRYDLQFRRLQNKGAHFIASDKAVESA